MPPIAFRHVRQYLASFDERLRQGRCKQSEVWRRDNTVLWHAHRPTHSSARDDQPAPAVLLIPPLMVRPEVYDLREGHSFTRRLLDRGMDVFTIDFGAPGRAERHKSLADHVLREIQPSLQVIRELTSGAPVYLVGYCMGGLFGLMTAATAGTDTPIAGVAAIGSPLDFRQSWLLWNAPRLGWPAVHLLLETWGNIPGELSSIAFRLLGVPQVPQRVSKLLGSWHDPEILDAHLAIHRWLTSLVDCPAQSCKELLGGIILRNALFEGTLRLESKTVHLRNVTCPVIAFAGRDDILAPPRAVRAILEVVSTDDKQFHVVEGGHVAVIDGNRAPQQVWEPVIEWIETRNRNTRPQQF